MRRPAAALALAAALAPLVGCPDWSRPDPRLRERAVAAPAAAPAAAAPAGTGQAAAATPAPGRGAAALDAALADLRARCAALGAGADPAAWRAALADLGALETRGFDLLERGDAAEQAAAEALLEALAALRDDVVQRQPRGR